LGLVEVERRHSLERASLGKGVKIARHHNASGFGQLDVQHLMARRVPGRQLQDDGPIAEHVVFIAVDDDGLAGLQRRIAGGCVSATGSPRTWRRARTWANARNSVRFLAHLHF
jgi:hypothetical protein